METSSISSSLDLFATPTTDVGVEEVQTVSILPTSGAMNDNSLDFVIPAETSRYVDLNNTRLYLRVKVTKSDGGH